MDVVVNLRGTMDSSDIKTFFNNFGPWQLRSLKHKHLFK